MRRRLLALPTALLALLVATASVVAAPFPSVIPLPDGWQPEGIAAGPGTTVYAGSLANGAIARADVRSGEVEVLNAGATGRVIAGLDYQADGRRLWAAGATTGNVYVFDADDGTLLRTYPVGAGFINDIVVTADAVYATDSQDASFVVIPLPADGSLPATDAAFRRPLTGDWEQAPGFNANGITAKAGWLVIVQSSLARLYRVDPVTGTALVIDTGSFAAANGDGIELRGNALYIVQNRLNQVAVVRLAGDLLSGERTDTITSDAFRVPTTAAFAAGRLWLVNARFGTPPTPDTDYEIVGVPP